MNRGTLLVKNVVLASSDSNIEDDDDDDDEAGKFLELGQDITKAYGPLGIVTAGYEEESLDRIVSACEAALTPPDSISPYFPVAILGKSDLKQTFKEVLSQLMERDCLLPEDGDELVLVSSDGRANSSYLRYPLVLFSGFEVPQLQQALRYIESMEKELPAQPMCAMAVPNAMDKQMSQLLEEIEGDYHENQVKRSVPEA
eukprot:CAMPEP_0195520416 /NCGR_PEP_ID=MMETSP0794_2-20130614/16802_1 /TAXON_ID=515487 /ORGANISM="Stephanopyxis turris, Strain CCMP 815" /LENGTH=199 /DNA_ID=CAMNT_0040649763 /DNA_START=144 /DNA_END=743 /DNA_ORIENTATION=-